jgi:hypothetical protein
MEILPKLLAIFHQFGISYSESIDHIYAYECSASKRGKYCIFVISFFQIGDDEKDGFYVEIRHIGGCYYLYNIVLNELLAYNIGLCFLDGKSTHERVTHNILDSPFVPSLPTENSLQAAYSWCERLACFISEVPSPFNIQFVYEIDVMTTEQTNDVLFHDGHIGATSLIPALVKYAENSQDDLTVPAVTASLYALANIANQNTPSFSELVKCVPVVIATINHPDLHKMMHPRREALRCLLALCKHETIALSPDTIITIRMCSEWVFDEPAMQYAKEILRL